VIYEHYSHHIGSYIPRECMINFSTLGWLPRHLQHLELPVTEDEDPADEFAKDELRSSRERER
jgi:hypothetical protein